MNILILILVFYLGVMGGFFLKWWLNRRAEYSGQINIIEGDNKTLFSLELSENPDSLKNKDEVIFKVNRPKAPSH